MMIDEVDICGTAEVMKLFQPTLRQTVHYWMNNPKKGFPKPFMYLDATPLYDRKQILAWKAANPSLFIPRKRQDNVPMVRLSDRTI